MFVLEGAARLVADKAAGQNVHSVCHPAFRAAADNIVSVLIITFVFESVKLLIEYAGIQQIVYFYHLFRVSGDRELCGCGLYEAA